MRQGSGAPQRVTGRGTSPMLSVAAITAIALVGVGVLAVQANGSAPKVAAKTVAVAQQPTANPSGQPAQQDPLALPANSGQGKRIVYSLGKSMIWLVNADGTTQAPAKVVAATVPAPKGNYTVTSWLNTSKGQDGTSVQYVVLWGTSSDSTQYGFDAVANVQGMPPAPTKPTRGVRMMQEDALRVWAFATQAAGTPVNVVD